MSGATAAGLHPEAVGPIEGLPPIAFLRPPAVGRPNVEIGRGWETDFALAVAWWDWPVEKITRKLAAIGAADLRALEEAS